MWRSRACSGRRRLAGWRTIASMLSNMTPRALQTSDVVGIKAVDGRTPVDGAVGALIQDRLLFRKRCVAIEACASLCVLQFRQLPEHGGTACETVARGAPFFVLSGVAPAARAGIECARGWRITGGRLALGRDREGPMGREKLCISLWDGGGPSAGDNCPDR